MLKSHNIKKVEELLTTVNYLNVYSWNMKIPVVLVNNKFMETTSTTVAC